MWKGAPGRGKEWSLGGERGHSPEFVFRGGGPLVRPRRHLPWFSSSKGGAAPAGGPRLVGWGVEWFVAGISVGGGVSVINNTCSGAMAWGVLYLNLIHL